MKVSKILLAAFGVVLLAVGAHAEEARLQIFGEPLPPYAFEEKGRVKGISVDLLVEMLKRAGRPETRADIILVNWARAYSELQVRPNTVLFSTIRSEEREPMFKWVGPIRISRISAIARRDKAVRIQRLQDMNNYRICVSRDSVGHELLLNAGVKPSAFVPIVAETGGARILARNRADVWVAEEIMANWEFVRNGLDPAEYESVDVVVEEELSYAFNKDTDTAIVLALQATLDAMKADGTYNAILAPYMKSVYAAQR